MNLEEKIRIILDEKLAKEDSDINVNNNNSNQNNQSYQVVQKCLKEVCKIYKIACLIELVVFLILMSILIIFNLIEVNAHKFWQINYTLEETLLELNGFDKHLNTFELDNFPILFSKLNNIFNNTIFLKSNLIISNKIRLRHQKVIENCNFSILDLYNLTNTTCYPIYSAESEEKHKPTLGWKYEKSFVYCNQYQDEIEIYENSGYIYDYTRSTGTPLDQFIRNEIKKQTRLFSIELIIYNHNLKSLSDFKIMIKKRPTGMHYFKWKVFTLKISENRHLKAILIFSTMFLVYYGWEKLIEIRKGESFKPYRLLGDIFDIMIFYYLIYTLIYTTRLVKLLNISVNIKQFNLVEIIQSYNDIYYNVIKVYINEYNYFIYYFNMFTVISFSRLLKHSILFRPLEIIIRSLRTICYNILQFSPFFFLIFIAFALFGVGLFGSIMKEFQTLSMAILTLTSILLGEIKYENYYEFNGLIGTVYFCSYVMVIAIICVNIISAIVNESYESMRDYLNDESQKYHITPDNSFVQRNFNLIIKLSSNYYEPEIRSILEKMQQMSSSNRVLTKLEIESYLAKLDYDRVSLESMMLKYGIDTHETEWKKNQMDQFRHQIMKERQDLDDLFVINMKLNEDKFKKRMELEMSKQIFVSKDKYYNLEQKVYRLKNVIKAVDLKSKTIISNIKLLKNNKQ